MEELSLLAELLHKCHIVYGENGVNEKKTFVCSLCLKTNMEVFTINVLLLKRPKTEVLKLDLTSFCITMSSVQQTIFLVQVIVKYMEKNPDRYNETLLYRTYFSSYSVLRYVSRFLCSGKMYIIIYNNSGEWLWNSTNFIVVGFCSLFWRRPCTKRTQ